MGAGSSVASTEEKLMENAPIRFAPLQADGNVQHRTEFEGGIRSTTAKGDIFRPSGGQSVLEAQAAAHWNRIIEHTRNI